MPALLLLLHTLFIFIVASKCAIGADMIDAIYDLPCRKLDPKFNDCINKNLETGIRSLANGNEQLGRLQLDPLIIDAIHLEHTLGSLDIDQKFSHVKVTGFSTSNITNAHMDVDNNCQIYLESFTPTVVLESEFSINGHFYLVPISAKGPATVTIKNLKAAHNLTCTRYKKRGIEHLRVTSYDIDLKPESVNYKFENIIDEDSQLNDEVHNLFNSNSLAVFKQGLAPTKNAYEVIFMKIGNKLLAKIPLSAIVQE